ncbi:hypothetical protein [Kozakia baliensis]|uniref:hypothetical protein n=1 Tax=Kozakia baliensis TaxID=153496 RepID=UPI00049715C5|nr:hypothetical protein [Kozakia baliensis]AOX18963.1 hypothetical protein A0U90_00085 [Kozakia baliensis]
MPSARRTAWFAPKRYGYGAGRPLCWQGWVLLLSFMAVMMLPWSALHFIRAEKTTLAIMIAFSSVLNMVATIYFLWVCKTRTAGGWRWRWGEGDR